MDVRVRGVFPMPRLWVWKGRTDVGSRSAASEGVCGTINMWDIWSEPGGQIAQISAERRGAAAGDEKAVCVRGVFPPPMGYGKGGQM